MNMFGIKNKKSNKKVASIGMEFDYSNPNIAYLTGGGGGGGQIVQSTNPQSAMLAGGLNSAAAGQASRIYSDSINQAIQAINQNFVGAEHAVQPYQQTGVAALDQLNQYLGLPAYNPGKGPTDPNTWSPDSMDIQDYVDSHSNVTTAGKDGNIYTNYTGIGAAYDGWSRTSAQGGPTGMDLIGYGGTGGVNAAQSAQIASALKQQYVKQNIDQYNVDLENFNANKSLYDQYQAAGPLTQAQITNNIENQPGYQSQLAAGVNAIGSDASAKGYLGSGKILKDLSNYGQNTFSQYYGNTLSRLAGLVDIGANTAQSLSAGFQNKGNSLAGLYTSLGQNQANSILAGANAQSQGIITAGQQFNQMGGDGGLGGIGAILGGIGSVASAFSPVHV